MNFCRALSFSAIESIGARFFDLLILGIIFNALNDSDVAVFGLATSAIFLFNAIFIAPETGLFKFQKEWKSQGELDKYISSFVLFNFVKLGLHYLILIILYFTFVSSHWLVYAVLFSAITQHIQLSEITRIYMRMELQQRKVALFENTSRALLLIFILTLFLNPLIEIYFTIYFIWSLITAIFWIFILDRFIKIELDWGVESFRRVVNALMGYSLWGHIIGILTTFFYNANLLLMGWFSFSDKDIALYTVVNRIAILFFFLPLFFQSFVPIILSNSKENENQEFRKILIYSVVVSFFQFIFFIFFWKINCQYIWCKRSRGRIAVLLSWVNYLFWCICFKLRSSINFIFAG